MERIKIIGFYSILTIIAVLSGCSAQNKIAAQDINFSPSQEECLKIMTFNIRTAHAWWLDGWSFNNWDNRKRAVIDTIVKNAADVIGFQEGVDYQLKELEKALPQYTKYAVGRVDGKNRGETCAIFYRNDRFELLDSGSFWFSKKPSKPGSKNWGNLFARLCSWVLLEDKNNQTSFYVYNVHLDNWSQYSREKSVRLLANKISTRKTQSPFILVGDFNMVIDNPAMQYLEEFRKQDSCPMMVNAWKSVHPENLKTGTYHKFWGGASCPKIDHISISESAQTLDVKIDRSKVNGRFPSDHYPVIATILIPTETIVSKKM